MLALTCARADLASGQDVLELGCGWGSLTLWMAEAYPTSRILAVSNSVPQRQFIMSQARERGLPNVDVVTRDMNVFTTDRRFDRVVSVEMFEHMRNWAGLLRRVAGWLEPGGRAFVHVFTHRHVAYRFDGTWAAARFFTGGVMASHDLLPRFQQDMVVSDRWAVDGTHYSRTLRAWLERLDAHAGEARALLGGGREGRRRLAAWRLFLLSTEEIWGHRGGDEWLVSHYLLEPRGGNGTKPLVRSTYAA
jgi:cyclopropane-fatty-acyl-phospholipid synthase